MKPQHRLRTLYPITSAILLTTAALGSTALITGCRKGDSAGASNVGQTMTPEQEKAVKDAADLMAADKLTDDAALTRDLLDKHIWKAATADDQYLKDSEKAGFTPYAYTLSDGKSPSAIVLAPRFFTEATPIGRAALMIHELGHYRAYVATGKSDEVDGYKVEYDKHKQLNLTEADSLVYFSMLDGVEQYVVPKYPQYKTYPDVKQYMSQ